MSATKRHNPAKYDRVREAIEQSRERKRRLKAADERAAKVYELIAGIVQRRSDKLGAAVEATFAYQPGTKFTRGGHRGSMARAARMAWRLAHDLGFPIRLEFEHVPLDRPKSPSPAFHGPRRHRDYDLPPSKVSFDWDPLYDRIRHESDPLEDEAEARLRAARDQWCRSVGRTCVRGLGTVLADNSEAVQQRFAHHPRCGSRHPVPGVVRKSAAGKLFNPLGECDCDFQFLRRSGALTISIERQGRVKQIQAAMLTQSQIRFVDPDRREQPGDEAGFTGEFPTDNHGMVLVPWDRPFIEYGDGTISFVDAGLPRKRKPEAAS